MSLLKSSLVAGGAMLALASIALIVTPRIHQYNQNINQELDAILREEGNKVDFTKVPLTDEEKRRYQEASKDFVRIEYDKFLDCTSIEPKRDFPIGGDIEFGMRILYANNENSPTACILSWTRKSKDWRWLRRHDVVWLVDGERWISKENFDSETYSGGVLEFVNNEMTLQQFSRIASAESALVRVGGDELEISKDQKVMMQLLIYAALANRGFAIKQSNAAITPQQAL